MQRAAASEIPPVLQGLACGGGVEGHQPPMQLFPGGENILLGLLWIQQLCNQGAACFSCWSE